MSKFTINVSESGSFISVGEFYSRPIFNLGVYEDRRDLFQQTERQDAIDKWRRKNVGKKKWKFTDAQIDAYADAAVKLTANISASNASCRLAPLRGAARPCMLVEVMSGGAVEFEFFDFRNGSKGFRDREIIGDLIAILNRMNTHTDIFRIQIVDTAKGGNGVKKLVFLLREIHDNHQAFRNQFWFTDIHLLHPQVPRQNIDNINSARLIYSSKFKVDDIHFYPVPVVVGEDFDEASDFEFVKENGIFTPRPRESAGGFLLERRNRESLIETANVFLTLDQFFSEAVTHSLLTDPNRALAEIVWKKVHSKARDPQLKS